MIKPKVAPHLEGHTTNEGGVVSFTMTGSSRASP